MKTTIPSEILLNIFQYLSPKELKKNISSTCKQWRAVVQDFLLVTVSVKVGFPLQQYFVKLLQDFEVSPAFGYSVTSMVITDYQRELEDEVDKFRQIFKSCPNLQEFKIICSVHFYGLLENIISDKTQQKLRLKSLDIRFKPNTNPEVTTSAITNGTETLDFKKLISQTTTCLSELTIDDKEYNTWHPLVFMISDSCYSENGFLTQIKIDCTRFRITQGCLDYIASGTFTALQYLYLNMRLVGSYNEESTDKILDNLKQLCLHTIKSYNIAFSDDDELNLCIFSIDNCQNEEERYSNAYLEYDFTDEMYYLDQDYELAFGQFFDHDYY